MGVYPRSGYVLAVFLIMAIIAVAAFAPSGSDDRKTPGEAAASPAGVDRLSATRLAAAVPDPIIVFDGAGAILHANPAAEKTFGDLPAGISMRLKFRAPEMQALIDRVIGGQPGQSVDLVERIPVERMFKVSAALVDEGAGVYLVLFKDQSETRRIDRMRADFIANASHELRTPLASVSGFIETLRGPARNDAKARENFLEIMQAQTARMARLIDDLLSLSRLEMKPYAISDEDIDIRRIVEGVLDALAHLAGELGVEFVQQYGNEPVLIPGNADEFIQVFENLVENAVKYGHSGGRVEVSIALSEATPHPEVRVSIRDFGPGIPEEHIPRITERFYRVDVENSRAQKGTGLGLSIVRHILTRHGGRLTIQSTPGDGAEFTVHLPAVRG